VEARRTARQMDVRLPTVRVVYTALIRHFLGLAQPQQIADIGVVKLQTATVATFVLKGANRSHHKHPVAVSLKSVPRIVVEALDATALTTAPTSVQNAAVLLRIVPLMAVWQMTVIVDSSVRIRRYHAVEQL